MMTLVIVWVVALALLGLLAWAVMRSKAPAPALSETAVAAPALASAGVSEADGKAKKK